MTTLMDNQSAQFVDRVVLITGGLSGVGLAAALMYQDRGAKVVVTTRYAEKAAAFVDQQVNDNKDHPIDVRVADVRQEQQHVQLYQYITEEYGRLDVLCPNAAVGFWNNHTVADDEEVEIANTSAEHLSQELATNFSGVVYSIEKAIKLLKHTAKIAAAANEPEPAIVIVSSTAGHKGMAHMPVYAATKAAQRSLGRSYAAQLISYGIRVNVLSPGCIDTPFWAFIGCDTFYQQSSGRLLRGEAALEAVADYYLKETPAGRFASAEEIAKAIIYLSSSDSVYQHGSELVVDGGLTQL
jgi:NAD(P)-dependent dehydrogenase (short-subunit alcohol dehydrogenase family)